MFFILLETLRIFRDTAVYLLLGFLLAGVLNVLFLRRRNLLAPLEGRGVRPILLAALLGTPMPLCSCSVLPAGVTLHRRGASRGTTASFLITVPETDIVSIFLTYGLLGPAMAILRPVAALVTGIGTGLCINLVERRRDRRAIGTAGIPDASGATSAAVPVPERGAGGSTPVPASGATAGSMAKPASAAPPASPPSPLVTIDPVPEASEGSPARQSSAPPPRRSWFGEALYYGFGEFFNDLIGRLILGVVLGASIAVLLPRIDPLQFGGSTMFTYALMVVLGIPLYVCATASTPIAAGFIAAGVSPGAALVFLLVGPATNLASLLILVKQFGRLIFGIYLSLIVAISVLMGLASDLLFRWIGPPLPAVSAESGGLRILGTLATIVLLLLYLRTLRRRRALERSAAWIERTTGIRLTRVRLAASLGTIAVIGYLASGFFVVGPAERAAVTRFGAVTADYLGPGLRYHWPAPFGGADRVSVREIRRVELGLGGGAVGGRGAASGAPALPSTRGLGARSRTAVGVGDVSGVGLTDQVVSPTDSWVLTGDENIIDIQAVAQYQVVDDPASVRRFLYGLDDPDGLVRATAERALQEAIGSRPIDSLLTEYREDVEEEVREHLMQPALDAYGAGIRVVGFTLLSVHAPSPTHWAFRDVAGAVEDAATYVHQAREYAEGIVRDAQGDSARGVELSRGQSTERVQKATGEAFSFLAQCAEYRRAPQLTRSRLYLEKLEEVLPGLDLYVDLTGSKGDGPSIWVRRGPGFEEVPFIGRGAPDQTRPRSSRGGGSP